MIMMSKQACELFKDINYDLDIFNIDQLLLRIYVVQFNICTYIFITSTASFVHHLCAKF